MRLAAFAAALFAVAFLLHWLWWRLRRPRRALGALLVAFFGTLIVGLVAAPHLPGIATFAPVGFWEHLHVVLFHVSFSLAYTVTYSALEMDSPTLTLVAFVAAGGSAGRSRAELLDVISDREMFGDRFAALTAAGILAPAAETGYVLTVKGQRWAEVFRGLRRLYRLQKGG
jgi:hypothetical protein